MKIRVFRFMIGLWALLMGQMLMAKPTFRGAWIATVANIDWPSPQAVGDTARQKREMVDMLDSLHSLGINAVIFQVRPTADALYLSYLEPYSHWLSGRQDSVMLPSVFYQGPQLFDPLAFVCQQAHLRDMEVHAWLNPYRVNLPVTNVANLAANHIYHLHPEWFWRYGSQWYFNPAMEETRDWICAIVEDIVCRYPVDAIHMDDYFYPYPISGKPLPDERDFKANSRGFTDIRDWRRDNVNLTVRAISYTVHTTRPGVQFGISPFGIWRNRDQDPRGSNTHGLSNYDDLYADILLWMQQGWIDYVMPQLYWEIGKPIADYRILAQWWAEHKANCWLYIGMAPYRLGGAKEAAAWRQGNEIARQMRLNRHLPGIDGECFYSTRPLLSNPLHVCDSIRVIYAE